jgi:hypothetical protein
VTDDGQVVVNHAELRDGPTFTGPTLRGDGRVGIFIRGRGLFAGPLLPEQLRALAWSAMRIADDLDRQAEAAGDAVLQQLAGLSGSEP